MTTENNDATPKTREAGDPTFISTLKEGRERFLAHAIEHGFVCGRRTAQDFIRHFPPRAIMKGLEYQPGLRASILVLTTGIKHKIAIKKEWEDAATDLQIALDEGETDAESVVALFDPDDRVRYLDPRKIWAFLTEGEFWKASASNKTLADVAKNHVAFLLERALEDKLITHRDVVEGVTVEELSNRLPKTELGRLIQCALHNAERGTSFTEVDLLATTPPRTLVQYLPLPNLWESIIATRIAARHGYVSEPEAHAASASTPHAAQAAASSAHAAPAPASSAHTAPAPAAAAAPIEAPKPTLPDAAATPVASGVKDVSLKPVPPPKTKDAPLPKDSPFVKQDSKVKLKQPEPPVARPDPGPGLAKSQDPFGDEEDDIEVIEDDAKAV
jgi:hypothetical protein